MYSDSSDDWRRRAVGLSEENERLHDRIRQLERQLDSRLGPRPPGPPMLYVTVEEFLRESYPHLAAVLQHVSPDLERTVKRAMQGYGQRCSAGRGDG